jgi:YVTN family beta-propeller protein
MSRRDFLRGAAAAAAIVGATTDVSPRRSAGAAAVAAAPALLGYAFGTRFQDVSVFDPVSRQLIETRPLGATIRWLSNEQTFWDGHYIWSYDFPKNLVEAVAIDPVHLQVAARIPTEGAGPAHSLMLTPDRQSAWVNLAGSNEIAVLDVPTRSVVARIPTGKFP